MPWRAVLVALLVVAAFGAGRALPRPAAPLPPIAEAAERPAPAPPGLDSCKRDLASTKAQLAICVAYRAPSDGASAPAADTDPETARLVRSGTTNTEALLIQGPKGGMRAVLPGTWPPPEGPPAGWHVIARKVDGGMEWFRDGGTEIMAAPEHPMVCPCPKDDAGIPVRATSGPAALVGGCPCPRDDPDAGEAP